MRAMAMTWYAWYDEEDLIADEAGVRLFREWRLWRELWEQVLSGLAWSG